jgi:hypothetical protein
MSQVNQIKTSLSAAACLNRAAGFLAECQRPALSVAEESTPVALESALTELVASAELFGCRHSFWRWAADAAELLGRASDALTYRQRFSAGREV